MFQTDLPSGVTFPSIHICVCGTDLKTYDKQLSYDTVKTQVI